MVMGVCRRVLPMRHDAEDAFQITFLLLVQKSGTIRRPERLANWLFGVAYRVAARIRTKARKKESLGMHSLESPADVVSRHTSAGKAPPAARSAWTYVDFRTFRDAAR